MAQRKDMMRIIRQDAGFSAKLGFGRTVAAPKVGEADTVGAIVAAAAAAPVGSAVAPIVAAAPLQDSNDRPDDAHKVEENAESQKVATRPPVAQPKPTKVDRVTMSSATRGQVVYVALSLTTWQAAHAEAWADVARCSVQFLIRRVAQGLREEVFDAWERGGMPDVDETRGTRGKHSTSVTLTLQPKFAAALAAKHDPLGVLGLARVMGPAYRARFYEAFDEALAKAKIQMMNEGIET